MLFNDTQIELLQNLYNDASLRFITDQKLYKHSKSNGETGYALSKINGLYGLHSLNIDFKPKSHFFHIPALIT
jgi:hypothetical protein